MFLVRPRVFDEERVISEFYKNERIACELSQPHTMAQGDRFMMAMAMIMVMRMLTMILRRTMKIK